MLLLLLPAAAREQVMALRRGAARWRVACRILRLRVRDCVLGACVRGPWVSRGSEWCVCVWVCLCVFGVGGRLVRS